MNHIENRLRVFPACLVEMPVSARGKRAAFYLAAEEYVAAHFPEDNYLFTWTLGPTVVMGRNQVASAELDLDFCRREGIDVIRRKSGGGCIFADEGNIMISLITGSGAVEPLFAEYAECVAAALRRLGAEVEVSGRNDILLSGHGKICGNAFYHLPNRNIVHGTMLYDTTPYRMAGALTPDEQKLQAAGVKSVKSRVGLLKNVLSIGLKELEQELRRSLTDRSIRLTEEDIEHIKTIEADYYDPEFLYGKRERRGITRSARIAGCGRVSLLLDVRDDRIVDVDLKGDFFEQGDAADRLRLALVGRRPESDDLVAAIREHHPERAIRGLGEETLIALMLGEDI